MCYAGVSGGFGLDFIDGRVDLGQFYLDLLWEVCLEIEDFFSKKG